MASATCPIVDRSTSVIRQNMARIKLFTVAGPLLCHAAQANRVVRLLENRRSWGIERPLVMLAVHNNDEKVGAERFQSGVACDLARYVIVQQKGHNEIVWRDEKLGKRNKRICRIFGIVGRHQDSPSVKRETSKYDE